MTDLFLPLALTIALLPALAFIGQNLHILLDLARRRDWQEFWPCLCANLIAACLLSSVTIWAGVHLVYTGG